METPIKITLQSLLKQTYGEDHNVKAWHQLLAKADKVLPQGRNNGDHLTLDQIKQLGFTFPT